MGQVMGFNCAEDTNPAFEWFRPWCTARMHSWYAGFLKANGLAEKLLNKDWTGFAHIYNGPSY